MYIYNFLLFIPGACVCDFLLLLFSLRCLCAFHYPLYGVLLKSEGGREGWSRWKVEKSQGIICEEDESCTLAGLSDADEAKKKKGRKVVEVD